MKTIRLFLFADLGVKSDTWLGLNDIAIENKFVWSDGTDSAYRNWYRTEPNDANGGEDCALIIPTWQGMTWIDEKCSKNFTFVCKLSCV